MNDWNVSLVTDFSELFKDDVSFNEPIGRWNVSSSNSFAYMFSGAAAFNQPLGGWNTHNVTNFVSFDIQLMH